MCPDRGSHQLTTARKELTELEWVRRKEKFDDIWAAHRESKAAYQAHDDMPNHDGTKATQFVFWNDDTST
jgi:hypothetical protein